MKILAIDPATKCGWAHTDGQSGTWNLSVRKDESSGMRLVRLQSKLNEIKSLGLDLLVFEAARSLQHGDAIRVAAEIQGVLKIWCENNKVQYRAYSPAEIKKHATGKGNVGKESMALAAKHRWPMMDFVDDNHIDAVWLLDLAAQEYGGVQA